MHFEVRSSQEFAPKRARKPFALARGFSMLIVGLAAFFGVAFVAVGFASPAQASCTTGLALSTGGCGNIDRHWDNTGPNPPWTATGYFRPAISGSYQFWALVDDVDANNSDSFVEINGQRLGRPGSVNDPTNRWWGYTPRVTLTMEANLTYSVNAKNTYANDGSSTIRLFYRLPDGSEAVVPTERFTTIAAVPQAPVLTASNPPTGTAQVGATLTSASTYSALPAATMTYQWQSSADGNTWTDVSGAGSSTFVPTASHANQFIRVRTTATNSQGSANDTSPSVGAIGLPATGTPSVAASSDLGTSNSDAITSDNTPQIDVSGLVSGSTVTVTATNGSETKTCTFTATSSSGGCSLPELSDGAWNVSSTQSINGVNSQASAARSVSIDTTPPGIPAYSFSSGGTAVSDGGVTSSNSLSFTSGPTSSGSSSISCSFNGGARQTPCPASFSPLLSGANSVVMTAVDASGNESTSTFSLNYLGQTATTLAGSSDTGVSNSDGITTDNTPQINVSGLVVGATVTVTGTSGGQTATCTFVATASTGGCSLPALADGAWSVASSQSLGGTSTAASTAVNLTVDTQAPSAPGAPTATPTGGTPVANQISAATTSVNLSAPITAGQATGGRAEFYLNGVLVGTDNSISSGDTSVSVTPNLADLTASGALTVRLYDAAGNSIESVTSTALTVDRTIPAVNSFAPSSGQSPNTASDPMSFDLVMSEPISGLTGSDFTNAGTATGCVFTPSASSGSTFSVTVTGCSAGTVQPRLNASSVSDGVNTGPSANSSVAGADAINFVTTPPSGTGAPSISALSPGTTTTLGSTLSATAGTWNDQGDASATTSYQWQVCTSALASSCTNIPGQVDPTFVPTGTYDGSYLRVVTNRSNVAGTSAAQSSTLVGPMTRSAQTISFTGPSSQTFLTTPLNITGSSNRGLTVAFTSTTPTICSVSGTAVTMLSSGTCTLQADQPGDSMFLPASAVTQSFAISRSAQTIVISPTSQAFAVGSTLALASSAPGSGAITYTLASGGSFCALSGNVLTALAPGDCTVTSTIAQDGAYLTATSTAVTYSSRIARTASLSVPNGALLTDGTAQVTASLSTGGAPGIYAGPPEVCRASGLTIILIGAGDCYVSTINPADSTYMGADPITQVFKVGGLPATPVINGVTLNGTTANVSFTPGGMGGASSITDYTITATPIGGGIPITVRCTTSPCAVPGLTPGKKYDFSASANGFVGGKPVTSAPASYGPVDIAAPSTITIQPPSRSDIANGSFALDASSSLGGALPLSYSSLTPSVCTVTAAGRVSVVGPGTCSIVAGHAGGTVNGVLYSPASQTISFVIPKKTDDSASNPGNKPSSNGSGLKPFNNQASGSRGPSTSPSSSYVMVNGDGSAWAYANFASPLKRPITVEFLVRNADGEVIDRIKVRVPAGQSAAKARIAAFPPGGSVSVLVESNASPRARRAFSVIHAPSNELGWQQATEQPGSGMCERIQFAADSARLSDGAKQSLASCARKLDGKGGVAVVAGFVRNGGGNQRDQMSLADRRARAVTDELIELGVRINVRFGGLGAVTKDIGVPIHRRVDIRWMAQGD